MEGYGKITAPSNTFYFPDAMIQYLFENGLIWLCGNCRDWHLTVDAEDAGFEVALIMYGLMHGYEVSDEDPEP